MLQGCASSGMLWAVMPGGAPERLDTGTPALSLHAMSLPSSRTWLYCSSLMGAKGCFWGCTGVGGALVSKQSLVLSTNTALLRSAMVFRAERMWESGWWATGALILPAPRYFPVLAISWHSFCPRGHSLFLSTLLLPTCNSQVSSFPHLLFCCLKTFGFGVFHAAIPPSISPETKVALLVSHPCLPIADLLLGCGKHLPSSEDVMWWGQPEP